MLLSDGFVCSLTLPPRCRFGLGKVHEELLLQPAAQPEVEEAAASQEEGENATVATPEVGDITGFNRLDFTEWPFR